MPRRRLVVLVTSMTLAMPAHALGQSAGDEEYQDPLSGPDATETQPAQSEPATPAPAQAEPAAAAAPAAPAQASELPRTGLPAAVVGGAGVLLLAGGAGLRRRA